MAQKYKVGDKVQIKSIDWYNQNKASDDEIRCYPAWFGKEHSKWCGKVMTISHVRADHYTMVEDLVGYWTDEMIEGLVEAKTKPLTYEETVEIIETMQGIGDSWECPEGYQFVDENGNVIHATKIVLEKKKKEYPKTYDECCNVLSLGEDSRLYTKGYKASLIQDFQKLLICRDAYWKIAGEEMGLGKPWEPDWKNHNIKYVLFNQEGEIDSVNTSGPRNYILSFPIEEMRDAFKENFKEEIETVKELL